MIDTPEKQSDVQLDAPAYPNRKVWWIVGGTLTGAVLLFGLVVAGVGVWTAASPQESRTLTEEYPGPITSAEAEVEVGGIVLEAASGTALELRTDVEWRGDEPETAASVNGGVFFARADCGARLAPWSGADDCRVGYTLGLPSGTAADARTDIGDIRIDGVDGEVTAETGVGDIEGVDLRTTDIEVHGGVGNVELEFAAVLGDINVTTGTGDVVIEVPDDGTTYAVRFDSGVGEQHIDIATDPNAAADRVITVNAGVGDLTVRYTD